MRKVNRGSGDTPGTPSIKYNFIMNVILKVSNIIFPLVTFPYVSRNLGVGGIGKVTFASSVVAYFVLVSSLGIPTYGTRICAQCRTDRRKLSKVTQELFFISSLSACIAYMAFLAVLFLTPRLCGDMGLMLVSSLSIALTGVGMEWFYQAIEQYDYIVCRNLLFKLLSVVLIFLLVKKPEDFLVYALITIIGTVGSNILNMIRVRKYISLSFLGEYDLKKHLVPILSFFLLTIAATVYNYLDTTMLGFMKDDEAVGYYTVAIKIKTILVSVITSLGTVLLPRISYYMEKEMRDEARRTIKNSLEFVVLLALPLVIFFSVEAENTILLLSGRDYLPAVRPMVIIMPTVLLIGLSNVTGIQILVPVNKEKYTVLSTIVGAVINLIINYTLIPVYGAGGAALGTVVAEFIVLCVQLPFVRQEVREAVRWKDYFKVVLCSAAAVSVLLALRKKWEGMPIMPQFILSAAVFWGIYGIAVLAVREELVWTQLHSMVNWRGKSTRK